MLATSSLPRGIERNQLLTAALWTGLLIAGCHRAPSDNHEKVASTAPAAPEEVAPAEESGGVTLTAEQAEKMGIVTEAAKSAEYIAETDGYGVVVAHETIAIAAAELETTRAAQHQSGAARERIEHLVGTPGAMSADALDAAARQSTTDNAALVLAQHRLSSVIGVGAAGQPAANESTLRELASGKTKLIRATFPLGDLQGSAPTSLRAAHLSALSSSPSRPLGGWRLNPVWDAPADASLPGRSFFALLRGSDAGEGERLLVWAPGAGPSLKGAVVPSAALVIHDGKYWCYEETKPNTYQRREVATDRLTADGYFVSEGISAGDKLVIAAAGLLLARASNPSTEAE